MSRVMMPLPTDHPLMVAWTKYRESEEYANSRRWALHGAHTDGSLWAAFMEGWNAAHGLGIGQPVPLHGGPMTQPIEGDAERSVSELEVGLRYLESLAASTGSASWQRIADFYRAALRGVTVRGDALDELERRLAAVQANCERVGQTAIAFDVADALLVYRARLTGEAAPPAVDGDALPVVEIGIGEPSRGTRTLFVEVGGVPLSGPLRASRDEAERDARTFAAALRHPPTLIPGREPRTLMYGPAEEVPNGD